MITSTDEIDSSLPTDLEEGNSGEMKNRAPCFSQIVIPKDSVLAVHQWQVRRVLDLCRKALLSLPDDALGRDPEGWFYRNELLSHVERVLRSSPITQAGASASALSTTVPDHSPASPSESEVLRMLTLRKELDPDAPDAIVLPESRLKAEEVILREAILDVLDEPSTDPQTLGVYVGDDYDEVNLLRLDFADAVIARARRIKKTDEADRLEKKRINDPD